MTSEGTGLPREQDAASGDGTRRQGRVARGSAPASAPGPLLFPVRPTSVRWVSVPYDVERSVVPFLTQRLQKSQAFFPLVMHKNIAVFISFRPLDISNTINDPPGPGFAF